MKLGRHAALTGLSRGVNLSSATPVTTQYTPTDGTLAANTAKDGLLGNMYRAKYTTTGTYAANTAVRIDLMTDRLTAYP